MSKYFEYKSLKVKKRPIDERTKHLIPEKRFYILENDYVEEILYAIQQQQEKSQPWNILLVGEPGTGKSELIMYLCSELNIPLVIIQGDGEQSVIDLVGAVSHREDKGGIFWQDGKIPFAIRHHCSILFDEINGVMPDVLMKTHSMLDDRRVLDLKEHIVEQTIDDRVVEVPEMLPVPNETICIGTMNPHDTGRHAGTKPLSPALDSRFDLRIEVNYLSEGSEIEMLIHETGIPKADAKKIVKVADKSRVAFRNQEISSPIDHRMTKAWARLSHKFGLARACRPTVLNRLDEADYDVMSGVLKSIGVMSPEGRSV